MCLTLTLLKNTLFYLPHSLSQLLFTSLVPPFQFKLQFLSHSFPTLFLFHYYTNQTRQKELIQFSSSVSFIMKMMMMMIISSVFALFLFKISYSATIVVDGVSQWKNPTVQIGDSIVFKNKNGYKLYIFQNRRAFNLCNFTQATLLTKPTSDVYTWHPSRLGFFYFSFKENNVSENSCEKLAITVSLQPPQENLPSSPAEAPLPSSGGVVSSSPSYSWPFKPRQTNTPTPAPTTGPIFPGTSPLPAPGKDGSIGGGSAGTSGIPFINSNPAVPLPTGEVDSAIIRPLPTSGDHRLQVVGILAVERFLCLVGIMMMVV